MSPSTHVQSLIDRNHAITTYTPPPTLTQLSALFASSPHIARTVIISCADPRCHPEAIFNLSAGNPADAAIVIRVQGGDFASALIPLLAIDSLINFTDLIILRHTDCGSCVFRDENIKAQLKERAAGKAADVEGMRFGEVTVPIEDAVRRDLKLLRENELVSEAIRKNAVGMVFDLETGKVHVVE